MLKLYNTLTRKKEVFEPLGKVVGIYSCGPTVYWYQHIGNLRTYIFADLLKRVLLFNGYEVKHVINVTDVGHLTSDADTGEDKMVVALKREGLPFTKEAMFKLAEKYFSVFRQDLKKLNVIEPDVWCKATQHIKEMIELIKRIEKNGYTYRGKQSGNVYFDTSKFKGYGKLARLKLEEKGKARIAEDPDKKNPRDFVLWFVASSKFKGHLLKWPSPWGEGWPGWHIECSAMSMHYLGETFDIHTGGVDHIPVHHTNEIAQSEAATGKQFVRYWLHGAFLTFKGKKVSKSTGGLFTLSELEEQGFKPLAYRYFCLTAHYRSELEFSFEALQAAQKSYERLKKIVAELEDDGKINQEYLTKFKEVINDDLDMPKALAILWKLIRDKNAEGKLRTIKEMDKVFGLDLLKKEKIEIPAKIKKLVEEREEARKKKDWSRADEIRELLKEKGWLVEDTSKGPIIMKK